MSYDEGRRWPVSRPIYPVSFASTPIAVLADGAIVVLFERDGYKKLTLARFGLRWLEAAK